MTLGRFLLSGFMGLLIFTAAVWSSRELNGSHLDDVHPSATGCAFLPEFRRRTNAKYLWIIPILDGVNISANASFCAEMHRLEQQEGFILGMHGVHHAVRPSGFEFENLPVSEARALLEFGVAIWQDAFGQAPLHFSFPGQWGTTEIVAVVREEYHMHVRTLLDGLLQRIYHCDDSFCGSAAFLCRSWALDVF